MTKYQILLCIYKYLDEHFDKNRSDKFVFYMTNLNPYLWADGTTSDPDYYYDFLNIINGYFEGNECSIEDGLKYAKMYITDYNKLEHEKFNSNIDEVEQVFSECTLNDWERINNSLPNSRKL